MDVKELEYITDNYGSTKLKLEINCNDFDYPMINALRKVCINQIPTYAFTPSKINIISNSSVFDNSYMRLRLSLLPINNINHNIKFLPLKYYKDNYFNDPNNDRHADDTYNIEYYLKAKNTGSEQLLNVSTNDLRISINNEIIDNAEIYSTEHPLLLIQLRITEEFECSLKAVVAVGEHDSIFNSAHVYYDNVSDKLYHFYIESSGQMSEYDLLIRGCEILIEKYTIIKQNVNDNIYQILITETNSLMIEIMNEDHTCGGPLNYILQNYAQFAGISKPNFIQKNILIKMKTDNDTNPVDIINKAIDECILIYEDFMKKLTLIHTGRK